MHLGRWLDKLGMKPTHPNRKLRLETELGKMAHKSLKRTIIVTKNVKVTIKSLKSDTARLKPIKKAKIFVSISRPKHSNNSNQAGC